MLREMRIRNFAIVEGIDIQFGEGLNVITGETGAGKSIIINAIELLTGGRSSSEFVRSGKNEASLDAFFEIDGSATLKSMNIPVDGTAIVRRVINKNGKSRAYINDRPVTVQTLSRFGQELIDLHGQHEHQSLLSVVEQRKILDAFGGLTPLTEAVGKLYAGYNELSGRLRDIKNSEREREQRIDMLKYQINEIKTASLKPDEKRLLMEERAILSNLSKLKHLSEISYNMLKAEQGSVIEKLSEVIKSIDELSGIDASAGDILRLLKDGEAIIDESAHTLREFKERYECDPYRIEEVETRLDAIEKLERKYGEGVEGILHHLRAAEDELSELEEISGKYVETGDESKEILKELEEMSTTLSRKRKDTAERVEGIIKKMLSELAIKNPDFRVMITQVQLSSTGKDKVEFLFSANPGEPPRPLHKIASGGELSRVMLALKSAFAEIDRRNILVFDEIDSGVGGKTADAVARKLKGISGNHQVLCITHLPQIASKADHHLYVHKETDKGTVKVEVIQLKDESRTEEIARMMSGTITETSLEHARELLQGSLN
ncbi:DNA repair protein RecN [bacterium BMS3Bbin06]|nr:DNA repair protein RecN [bacterium BMS3Bbin06]